MNLLKTIASAVFAATMTLGALPAAADEVLASRLSAILGEEREALAVVPDSRLDLLTSLPSAEERGLRFPGTRESLVQAGRLETPQVQGPWQRPPRDTSRLQRQGI